MCAAKKVARAESLLELSAFCVEKAVYAKRIVELTWRLAEKLLARE